MRVDLPSDLVGNNKTGFISPSADFLSFSNGAGLIMLKNNTYVNWHFKVIYNVVLPFSFILRHFAVLVVCSNAGSCV